MRNLTVLIGIPGAGKTTIAKSLFPGHVRVSFDALPNRTRNDEDKLIIRTCRKGLDIIVDSANVDRLKRMKYVRFAREFGYSVHALLIDTSLDAALARNEARERKVPEGLVRAYCEKLEMPTLDEGFDNVFIMWNDWDPRAKRRSS